MDLWDARLRYDLPHDAVPCAYPNSRDCGLVLAKCLQVEHDVVGAAQNKKWRAATTGASESQQEGDT